MTATPSPSSTPPSPVSPQAKSGTPFRMFGAAVRRLADESIWIGRVIFSSADRFYWDNGLTRAAALAYTTLLSLVPVLALAGSILASFIVRSEEVSQVSSFVLRQFIPNLEIADPEADEAQLPESSGSLPGQPTLPGQPSAAATAPAAATGAITVPPEAVPPESLPAGEVTGHPPQKRLKTDVFQGDVRLNKKALDRIIFSYIQEFGATLSSLNELAAVFLVITALLLFNSIEYTLNEVWQVHISRSILSRIGILCTIIVVWPILALSAFYTTNFLSEIRVTGPLVTVYNYLIPFVIDFLAFLMLYFVVPKAPVWFRSACFGALVAAALFGTAKALFAVYILNFTSYARIYETLAIIPIFLFWLYLAWTVVLFGAEISYQAQYLPRRGRIVKRALLSIGDGRLVLGLQALTIVAKAFLAGQRLPTERDLGEALGCSSMVLKPALDALEKVGVLTRSAGNGGKITLSRSPERIDLRELHRALVPGVEKPRFPQEISKLFSSLSDVKHHKPGTLADLLRLEEPSSQKQATKG